MSSERVSNDEKGRWWGEHLFRYLVVKDYLKGNEKILDIACGSGYGAALLAKALNTGSVIGGDLDQGAVDYCNSRFKELPVTFEVLDIFNLPFKKETFDIITSFETIEHVKDGALMLSKLEEVLKPNGLLFLSTPNFPVNSPKGFIENPYHIHEYTIGELRSLVLEKFEIVKFGGQKYNRYNNAGGLKKIGEFIEKILYLRGIRKLQIHIQDKIMKLFTGTGIYAGQQEFEIVTDDNEIAKCQTLFTILKKR